MKIKNNYEFGWKYNEAIILNLRENEFQDKLGNLKSRKNL